jgi:hypothetical protein
VGVALLGLSAGSVAITQNARMADRFGAATALAQQKVEQLRSLPLGSPALAPGRYEDGDNPLAADGGPGGPFWRAWEVSGPDTPGPGLMTVAVAVEWTDVRPHRARLAAYVRCGTVPCE